MSEKACAACLRRCWLLGELGAPLDYCAPDRARFSALMALEDHSLIRALAGRRRAEIEARFEAFLPDAPSDEGEIETLCRHCPTYPAQFKGDTGAPRLLNLAGGSERLVRLLEAPLVAIVGSRRPSDYGIEIARSLAEALTASGLTVAGALQDGIGAAALEGALVRSGNAVAVLGDGLGVPPPARRRALCRQLNRRGCAISELPHRCRSRRWGAVAGERIIAGLASAVVLVEGEEKAMDTAVAHAAIARSVPVGAVPGRVTSPLAAGTHALLRSGASLVAEAGDVLEMLGPLGASLVVDESACPSGAPALAPRLAEILKRISTGCDTAEKLSAEGSAREILLALGELELLGAVGRGDGGRYIPRMDSHFKRKVNRLGEAPASQAHPDTRRHL